MTLADAEPAVRALRKAAAGRDPDLSTTGRRTLDRLGVPTSRPHGNALVGWLRRVFGRLFP
jgi:hypothetical protein